MARVKDKTLHLSGRVGDIIYYELDGSFYARSALPKGKRTISERSVPAVKMFYNSSLIFRFLCPELREPWKVAAKEGRGNCRSLFISTNFHSFGPDGMSLCYDQLRLSKGHLPLPLDMCVTATEEAGKWKLVWDNQIVLYGASASDVLYIAEIHPDNPKVIRRVEGVYAIREEEECIFRVSTELGPEVYLYCFFSNHDRTAFSDDRHFHIRDKSLE